MDELRELGSLLVEERRRNSAISDQKIELCKQVAEARKLAEECRDAWADGDVFTGGRYYEFPWEEEDADKRKLV